MTTPIEIVGLSEGAPVRGKVFGTARRAQIQACIQDWLESLRTAGIDEPKTYIARMLRKTDFLAAIREHAPDLLEEVHGIAAGCEQPLELVLGTQLMDEEWAYRASVLGGGEPLQKCSSAAVHPRDGLTWIGQNMDLGGYTDGHQVLLQISPRGPAQGALIFTIGSMIGLMGVNARCVGVCVNSLPQLSSARKGLPVAFMIRKLLQAESLAQAADWVRTLPHATGQHYLIADPSGIRSFEASAARVLEYRSPDPARVVHTNHPLTEEKGVRYAAAVQANTEARLRSLMSRLMGGDADLAAMKAAFSSSDDPDHPVCRVPHPNGRLSSVTGMIGFTTGSMVSTLERGAQTIESWVSAGPPSLRGYAPVQLARHGLN